MADTSTSPLSKLKFLLPSPNSSTKGYTILPTSSKTSYYDESSTSLLSPSDDEFEDDCVDVEDEEEGEWTDAQLMDDARPGRRAGAKAEEGRK
jgi:hypothetical protein